MNTPALSVLKTPAYCSIQNAGTYGLRHEGVPVGGWMDRHSAMLANQLLQNQIYNPLLEFLGSGGEFRVLESVYIVFTGAQANITIEGKKVQLNQVIRVYPDQIISIGAFIIGNVLYLGLAGQMYTERKRTIIATFPTQYNTRLEKGMIIIGEWEQEIMPPTSRLQMKEIDQQKPLYIIPGPEFDWLNQQQKLALFQSDFTISSRSDRMAYVLLGPKITPEKSANMRTSAVMPGIVQWLPSGDMMILMRDCQTTGGYPRIAILEEAEINHLVQRPAGAKVRFSGHLPI